MYLQRLVATTAIVLMATNATAQSTKPSPPLGQTVTWKNFAHPKSDFELPATPPKGKYFQTNYPDNPTFIKKYNESVLWCHGMFDVRPTTTNVVFMAIVVDDFLDASIQALGAPISQSGGPEEITFAFSYVFGVVPAGEHTVTVWMASWGGAPAEFASTVAVLQCFEMLLPTQQK